MGRFDNFSSVAMLFTGAFLVSIGVIAFLNLEIQSRSKHGVQMKNENLFEALGRKISEIITSLKEKNSYRRSLLYHVFISGNTTRSSMRKLQYYTEEPSTNDQKAENDFTQTYHRKRHQERIEKVTKLSVKHKNNSVLKRRDTEKAIRFSDSVYDTLFSSNTSANSGMSKVLKNTLEVHENCYNTNDVLKIIAVTCLVNFIFWFLIIMCVNAFTKKQKMWKFNSIESLTSISSSGSESEMRQSQLKGEEHFCTPNHSCLLRNYVNSFTKKTEGEHQADEFRELFLLEENSSEKKSKAKECIHQRFIHLSNFIFDTVSLDKLKETKKKKLIAREKTNKILSSLSTDDLMF